jgi:IclR family pca regulon transcriptional regulator
MAKKINPSDDGSPLFVASIGKAMALLEVFRGSRERYLGVTDIAARLGTDKSTVQRITYTLVQLGYLERCPNTRRYGLGTRLLDLSYQYVRTHHLVEMATPHLIELRRACEERVDLSLFDGDSLVYLVRLQSKKEKFYTTLVGRRMPLFCTAGGRALLSKLPLDEARAIVERADRTPLTSKSITDVDEIMRRIEQAAHDGYSVAVGEAILGEVTVAAAIQGSEGRPVGAVHVAGSLSSRDHEAWLDKVLPPLMETMAALEHGRVA